MAAGRPPRRKRISHVEQVRLLRSFRGEEHFEFTPQYRDEMTSFFEPALKKILDGVRRQIDAVGSVDV